MSYYKRLPEENKHIFTSVDLEFEAFIKEIRSKYLGRDDGPDIETIKKAYRVAKFWHGTAMRENGQLFLYHILAVARRIYKDGITDTNTLAAALLHDTVGDTDYPLSLLEQDFNNVISSYVETVTELTHSESTANTVYLDMGNKSPLALYIIFADRHHNLATCQNMGEENIRKIVYHTKTLLIPLARQISCNLMADHLEDACMMATFPEEHANIRKCITYSYNASVKHINKTVREVADHCGDRADVDTNLILPTPLTVASEIKAMHNNRHISLKRADLFSHYSYKPRVEVIFNINTPLNCDPCIQFIKMINDLIKEGKIVVVNEHFTHPAISEGFAYVDVRDEFHNNIRFILCTSNDYYTHLNSISEKNVGYLNQTSILPNDKKIRVFTRNGDPMDLEKGSTVLDFAFILNTEIGSHYKGALVNGHPVDIDYVLQSEDRIVILKCDAETVKMNWFLILKTQTAKSRLISVMEKGAEK